MRDWFVQTIDRVEVRHVRQRLLDALPTCDEAASCLIVAGSDVVTFFPRRIHGVVAASWPARSRTTRISMSPTPSPSDAQAGAYGVTLTLDRGYRFEVDSELPGVNPFVIDEGLPLGEASGPNPARVLLAAMASCLGASLLFCLGKSRIQVHGLRINASGTTVRNAEGRLRVGPCSITLHPDVAVNDRPRMQRCVELFEDFCIVTASVRQGIPVSVQVESTDAAE